MLLVNLASAVVVGLHIEFQISIIEIAGRSKSDADAFIEDL